MAALQVRQTPLRLMSIICPQVSSESSCEAPLDRMPAFAETMSSRPNSATPASTAVFSESKSRTSACAVTIRRSSASTWRAVSARSAAVAIG